MFNEERTSKISTQVYIILTFNMVCHHQQSPTWIYFFLLSNHKWIRGRGSQFLVDVNSFVKNNKSVQWLNSFRLYILIARGDLILSFLLSVIWNLFWSSSREGNLSICSSCFLGLETLHIVIPQSRIKSVSRRIFSRL